MEPRPVSNPPNPWASTELEYLEDIPPSRLEVYEDQTRQILASNDSPDLGFGWSVNPYRGCFHACAYCLSGDTPVLMGNLEARPLAGVRTGDDIIGTEVRGDHWRYVRTRVLDHWTVQAMAYRITVEDGRQLTASGDHRFLTRRGWKHVTGAEQGAKRRPHLTIGSELLGTEVEGQAVKSSAPLRIVSIDPIGEMPLFDITTGTGDFVANGVITHNCYARPTHEYLSFGAGTDFDRKIVVKPQAPILLERAFEKKSWKGEVVVFSGVTDCYQPLEASYRLTRGCLEVCARYGNPVGIITKAPLIERDIDVLVALKERARVSVTISIPLWNVEHARAIEPFVTTPQRRVRIIERLAAAGIPVGVNVAPMIPGLGDEDIVKILEAARAAGASHAGFVFLRLPGSVAAVFEERLRAALPLRADKIMTRIREARGGKLYDPRFGKRQQGEGPYAEAARALFDATVRRLGFEQGIPAPAPVTFTRRQLTLL